MYTFVKRTIKKIILFYIFAILVVACSAGTQLTLGWKDNSNNEDGFKIERKISGQNWSKLLDVPFNTRKFVDTTVNPGVVYLYRVQAFNRAGYSSYTNTVSKTAPNTPPKIAYIVGRTIPKNTSSGWIKLNITDNESPIKNIAVAVTTNNDELTPQSRITIIRNADGEPSILITPTYNKSGKSEVTVRVSDGFLSWSAKFTLTVKE